MLRKLAREGLGFRLTRESCKDQYSLSFEGGSFVLVTAAKRNKDSGLRRSLESPYPEEETWGETTLFESV